MFLPPAAPSVLLVACGAAAAASVAAFAHRTGSLDTTGAAAAVAVGTAAFASGWRWGVVLLVFFITSSTLSAVGHAAKVERTEGRVAKGGARDALQVFANGGSFALLALAGTLTGNPTLTTAAIGAIATANGDTWATEIGVLFGEPRSLLSLRPVPPGTSGAISIPGTMAGIAGVLLMMATSHFLGIDERASGAIVAGGVAGMFTDSLLGATLQSHRWCEQCREFTERAVHTCGTTTSHRRGWRWLDNDRVNAMATVAGALVAGVLAR